MKFGIFGFGSIGKRHAKNIAEMHSDSEILVWTPNKSSSDNYYKTDINEIKKIQGNIKVIYEKSEIYNSTPDLILVCTPTAFHTEYCLMSIKNNIPFFVEKPLSHKHDEALKVANDSKKNKLNGFVGYDLRFYPLFKKIKEFIEKEELGKIYGFHASVGSYMPLWRKTDYTKIYSSRKEMGGGVVLDLSHEIDYLQYFFGKIKTVYSNPQRKSNLKIDVEDYVDAILKFENNISGTLHMDYLNKRGERNFKVIGERGTLTWDWYKHKLVISIDGMEKEFELKEFDVNEMYKDELKYVIENRDKKLNEKDNIISLEKGAETVRICEKIIEGGSHEL